jgi:hypothetical protein
MPLPQDIYGEFEVTARFDYNGAHVQWVNTPQLELERILPKVREHAASLKGEYQVQLHDDDPSDLIYLHLHLKRPPERADLIEIKGTVAAILVDTSWGGSS